MRTRGSKGSHIHLLSHAIRDLQISNASLAEHGITVYFRLPVSGDGDSARQFPHKCDYHAYILFPRSIVLYVFSSGLCFSCLHQRFSFNPSLVPAAPHPLWEIFLSTSAGYPVPVGAPQDAGEYRHCWQIT